MNIDDF